MLKIAEIKNAKFRKALQQVDSLLGDGGYTQAARLCAETYLALLAKRRDFIPAPSDPRNLPQFRDDLPESRSRLAGGTGGTVRTGWPNQGGIRFLYYEPGGPKISYEKEKIGLSEASSYFEFLMEEVIRDQRE